jgi:hypothetical protein
MQSLLDTKLWEIKQELSNELERSSYTTKSTMAVFDHLLSVVEKHLLVPEQKTIRNFLIKIRDDKLLRCLFDISICLGNTDEPEKLVMKLQKLYQSQPGKTKVTLNSTDRARDNYPTSSVQKP